MFPSMGPPCVPEKIWNACEPAMTVLPNLLATGILAVLFALAIMIWSAAFIRRKNGGAVLIMMSLFLCCVAADSFRP